MIFKIAVIGLLILLVCALDAIGEADTPTNQAMFDTALVASAFDRKGLIG